MNNLETIIKNDRNSFITAFNGIVRSSEAEYLLVLSSGSTMSEEMKRKLIDALNDSPEAVAAVPKMLYQFPDRMDGVILRLSAVGNLQINETLKYGYEADFLLRFIFNRKILYMPELGFKQTDQGNKEYRESGVDRNRDWYTDDIDKFLLKLIKNISELNYGKLPVLYQFYVMFYLKCRMEANEGDRNSGLFRPEESEEIIDKMREVLGYIDDSVIMECYEFPSYSEEYQFRRMMLYLKHGHFVPPVEIRAQRTKSRENKHVFAGNAALMDACGDMHPLDRKNMRLSGLGLMMNDVPVFSSNMLSCRINRIENEEGTLLIEGSFPDAFSNETFSYYMMLDDKRKEIEFTDLGEERKYFEKTSFKDYSFRVRIPLDDTDSKRHTLYFVIGYQDREYIIPFDMKSYCHKADDKSGKFCRQYGDWLVGTADYTVLGDTNAQPSQRVSCEDCMVIEKYSWLKKAGKVITRQFSAEK